LQIVGQFLLEKELKRLLHHLEELLCTNDGVLLAGAMSLQTVECFVVFLGEQSVFGAVRRQQRSNRE
jgi:hypothetical protein